MKIAAIALAVSMFSLPALAGGVQQSANESISGAQSNVYMNNPSKSTVRTNPGVGGPGLTTSNDTCAGSFGGGVSLPGFGVVAGKTYEMEACVRMKEAIFLEQKGLSGASTARFCMNKKIDEAMWVAGTPCPQSQQRYQQAAAKASGGQQQFVQRRVNPAKLAPGTRYSTDGGKTWRVR